MKHLPLTIIIFAAAITISSAAYAEEYTLSLKGSAFSPKEITIPADKKVKLIVKNLNPAPMDFESHDLNREKVIAGNGQAAVFVGPLKPGTYGFFDEFQADTKGTIIVK